MRASRHRQPFSHITLFVIAASLLLGRFAAAEEQVLFDGSSLDQWRGYGQEEVPEGWQVDEGTIHRAGQAGDLMTRGRFGDFELRLEWRVSKKANSGIMYLVQEASAPSYFTGPEYQVLDSSGEDTDSITRAGALYGLYAPTEVCDKPVGEWNSARIVHRQGHVEHWLNGQKIVECELGSDDWNQRVAGSKFASWKDFGKAADGHIVLQDHGDEVWYRNIVVVTLAEPSQEH